MKIISTGTKYTVTSDNIKSYDKLPAGFYTVHFGEFEGYSLEKEKPYEINEKIYGVHMEKVEKVLKSFNLFTRNLGVILSGNKGIGKSLFAKKLAMTTVDRGIPVIIVNNATPNISGFIASIEQEVMVLFDEFDKTFGYVDKEHNVETQSQLLSLFDGLNHGKKLFVVTCNELRNINDYLVNRPGRFHYHFRFDYPNGQEITEYLQDNLKKDYWGEIDKVVQFSNSVDINYDCLRSIAFEINCGYDFETAIQDLNIINNGREKYDVILHFDNGQRIISKGTYLDLFDDSDDNTTVYMRDSRNKYCVGNIEFSTENVKWSNEHGGHVVSADDIDLDLYDYEENDGKIDWEDDFNIILKSIKDGRPTYVEFRRKFDKNIHYTF